MKTVVQIAVLSVVGLLMFTMNSLAAEIPYSIGSWSEDGFGNHRAIVKVVTDSDAVRAHIEWRRRDTDPQKKAVLVFDSITKNQVSNVICVAVEREYGNIVFQPTSGAGNYEVYYLPYKAPQGNFGPDGDYIAPTDSTDAVWKAKYGNAATMKSLPEADVVEIQARNEFNRFDPMEVIATKDETEKLRDKYSKDDYLLFPEDRKFSIRMTDDLPYRWIKSGPRNSFTGKAQPGEYYVFQTGVYASKKTLQSLAVDISGLKSDSGKKTISAKSATCFNMGGIDWKGKRFTNRISVPKGKIQALWFGVQISRNAAGVYKGKIVIKPAGSVPKTIQVNLDVSGAVLTDCGDSELWRLSRLRWLNSTKGEEETLVPPYTSLQIKGHIVKCLGREIRFNSLGFLNSIKCNGTEILNSPSGMVILSAEKTNKWEPVSYKLIRSNAAVVEQEYVSVSGPLTMTVYSKTEFDGSITFRVSYKAVRPVKVKDIQLNVPLKKDITEYMMGVGCLGGYCPDKWDWKWDINRVQNFVWMGRPDAGLHVKLLYPRDNWPYVNLKDVGFPDSWCNGGKGGAGMRQDSDQTLMSFYTGPRILDSNKTLEFRFRYIVTPFRPFKRDWSIRPGIYKGGNYDVLFHGTPANPYINYPFTNDNALRQTAKKIRMNPEYRFHIYYTLRELSVHAEELWALRSFGDEIFQMNEGLIYHGKGAFINKAGGGHPWLREHLVTGYVPGWRQPLENGEMDLAIMTQGLSRWHNYYIEGLDWLMKKCGVDGLYLDGLGYDREVMKRVARVMYSNNPKYQIDFHEGNNYGYLDRRSNPAAMHMENLPYISSLWFGEMFDYNRGPDYWLIEVSGIPYGIYGDTLEYPGGPVFATPFKTMIFAMLPRMQESVPSLWKLWDDFGIQNANMIGYWDKKCPVKTGINDVPATVYQRKDKTLVVIASWSNTPVKCRLNIDWKALKLDPSKAMLYAPAYPNIQNAAKFNPTDEISIEPGKGWIFILK